MKYPSDQAGRQGKYLFGSARSPVHLFDWIRQNDARNGGGRRGSEQPRIPFFMACERTP